MAKNALCVGINNYPGTDSDLSGCVNDARDWAALLDSRSFNVQLMLDRKATGANLRAALRVLIGAAQPGDSVVFTYSGHGSFVPDLDGDEADGTDECLCPYDIRRNGPIADDELHEIFSGRARGVRLVMIADSCHSGTVARFNAVGTPPTARGRNAPKRLVRFLPPGAFLSVHETSGMGRRGPMRPASPPGRHSALLLAGCQDAEYSYDAWFRGRAKGAFTYVALQTLKTLKKSATYHDWYRAIRHELPNLQYPQSPSLFGTTTMRNWKIFADGPIQQSTRPANRPRMKNERGSKP